jgi:hypothetical protein
VAAFCGSNATLKTAFDGEVNWCGEASISLACEVASGKSCIKWLEAAVKLEINARRFDIVVAVMWSFVLVNDAVSCSPSPRAFNNRPKLGEIISSHPFVFIGTVVDSAERKMLIGTPPREIPAYRAAKIKVEIPIRGEVGDVFEVRNGGGGDCSNQFIVGQRWFFSGEKSGSNYFNGSTVLVDEFGNSRRTDALGVDHSEINEMFPEILTLSAPALVVQKYLAAGLHK